MVLEGLVLERFPEGIGTLVSTSKIVIHVRKIQRSKCSCGVTFSLVELKVGGPDQHGREKRWVVGVHQFKFVGRVSIRDFNNYKRGFVKATSKGGS